MRQRHFWSAVAALSAIGFPVSADAALPRGAMPPTSEWLLGGWVTRGGKCAVVGEVYFADGRAGSITSARRITILGRYSLRGSILTETVESRQYGDLVNVTRIGRIGRDELVSEIPNNTNPNITVPPKRRCPNQAGVEPWFPNIRFKGIAAYTVSPR